MRTVEATVSIASPSHDLDMFMSSIAWAPRKVRAEVDLRRLAEEFQPQTDRSMIVGLLFARPS